MKQFIYFLLTMVLALMTTHIYAQSVFGLTTNNQLFVLADPDSPEKITALNEVMFVTPGQQLLAVDIHPATGDLYALGYDERNNEAKVYIIDISVAVYVATPVNTEPVLLQLGSGERVGFEFHPVENLLHVTATNGNSYTLDPDNGLLDGTGLVTASYVDAGVPVLDIAAPYSDGGPTTIADDPNGTDELFLYPNPTNNTVRVLLPYVAENAVSVTILDLNGNIYRSLVYAPGGNELEIDVGAIPAGMYSLRVQQAGFQPQSARLMKQ